MKIKLSKSDWELIGQKTGWLKIKQSSNTLDKLTKTAQQLDISTEVKANDVAMLILDALEGALKDSKETFRQERKMTGKGSDEQVENKVKERCMHLIGILSEISLKYPQIHKELANEYMKVISMFEKKFTPHLEGGALEMEETTPEQIEEIKNKALDDFNAGKISKERLQSIMTELVASSLKKFQKIS